MTNDYGNLELHKVLLSAMKDIDKICRENNLKYYLYAGTLLGAVNHGGFIPWDDDIDVVMFEKDFFTLKSIIETKYTDYYNIISFENTEHWFSKMFKIQIKGANFIDMNNEASPVFIDISILHSVPDNGFLRFLQRKRIEFLNLSLSVLSGEIVPTNFKTKYTIGFYSKLGKEKLGKKLDKILTKYDKKNTYYVGIMCNTLSINYYNGMPGYEADITERSWHNNPIYLPFENTKFMTISEPAKYLTRMYGSKWSEPYPEEKRISRHFVKNYLISDRIKERVANLND